MTTLQMSSQERSIHFLRRVLQADALASGLSGALLIVAAKPLAAFIGVGLPLPLIITGAFLLLYAGGLLQQAAQDSLSRRFVTAVIIINVAWVIGSGLLLLTDLVSLTVAGKWAVALVADLVAVFAGLQFYGLRRLR
jgi:hypothetical protein